MKHALNVLFSFARTGYKLTRSYKSGQRLLAPVRKKAGLDKVRLMISGAAPLSADTAEGYAVLGFNLVNGYGLTEASPVICMGNPVGFVDNTSVGNLIPKVTWKILDADYDGIGEICVKGPNVMQGYFDNPEETAKMFTDDGWLKTGDMGYIGKIKDVEYLYITGRYKNIIVTDGGKNVYPEEIEELINKHPYVLESIVIGVPESDKDLSETPTALVVLDVPKIEQDQGSIDDIKDSIAEHMKLVNDQLKTYQKIRGYDIQDEELIKNSTRKVKRFEYKGKNYRHLLKKKG